MATKKNKASWVNLWGVGPGWTPPIPDSLAHIDTNIHRPWGAAAQRPFLTKIARAITGAPGFPPTSKPNAFMNDASSSVIGKKPKKPKKTTTPGVAYGNPNKEGLKPHPGKRPGTMARKKAR